MRYLLTMAIILFSGCGVEETWVRASRATYKIIGSEYSRYVAVDDKLSAEDKEARKILVESWDARIAEWEKEIEDGE